MKRLTIVLAFVIAASASALAQAGNVEQSIRGLMEQLRQASLKGDAATFDKLLADDYIVIGRTGSTFTKADVLENFKSGKLKYEAIEVTDTKVRVYGNTAVVNATLNIKGHSGDTDISGQFRTVRVWVKRKGQWQNVSHQYTRIATPSVAAEPVPLAIKGYDPVAYFTLGKPMPGLPAIEYEWNGYRYRFSRLEHRELFKADPVRYAPQFENFCAMALSKGELVVADPENWLISEGKLYIFGKPAPAGPALFQKDLAGNIAKANKNRSLIPKR